MALERTDYITKFSAQMVARLLAANLLEIDPGTDTVVSKYVAERLVGISQGGQLFTSFTKALFACPDVIELYADDEELKEVVNTLKY